MAGGGIAVESAGVDADEAKEGGFLALLRRRMSDAFRTGWVAVDSLEPPRPGSIVARGLSRESENIPPPPPGAGKSLSVGSIAEMLAWKSSKLTEGRKS